MDKNLEEGGLFGPCKHDHKLNVQAENKLCFKMSTENACDGPYSKSKCDAQVNLEDSALVGTLLDRFKSMWSVDVEPNPYIKFHHSPAGTPPMELHLDAYMSISFLLYLSDGGAETFFPFADTDSSETVVSVTPKKGSGVAWLNVHSNGSINPKSFHAVQGHPESAGDRKLAFFQVDLKYNVPDLAVASA